MPTIPSITSGQKRKIVSLGSDAIEKVLEELGLDQDAAQSIVVNGGDFAAVIREAAYRSLKGLSTPNEFADEEKSSNYGYPKGWKLKPVSEQAAILAKKFPDLDVSRVEEFARRYEKDGKLILPKGMDGLVVIPKHSAAARLSKDNEQWPAYSRALAYLFGVMKAARPEFVDYTEGAVGPDRERLASKTAAVYAELEKVPGDVLVLAVQTGFLHRGKSVRRARVVFTGKEFGLDSFAVGCIVLTHPERLNRSDVLWIDCAGSERVPRAGGAFSDASCWRFGYGRLEFDSDWVSGPSGSCGSASGVRPE